LTNDNKPKKGLSSLIRKALGKIRPTQAQEVEEKESEDESSKRRRPGRKNHKPDSGHPHPKPKPAPETQTAKAPPKDKPWVAPEIPKKEGDLRFCDIGLDPALYRAVCELGFEYCTPIQKETLLRTLTGKDMIGRAQTGTGKTAAFLLTAMDRFLKKPLDQPRNGTPRALVLAPTRELAIQIHKDAESIGAHAGLNNLVVFGGLNYQKQQQQMHHPIDILVATPGRLLDFIGRRLINLREVEILIIDEADRMLDMGFIPDVRRIEGMCPQKDERQTMMWSATFNDSVMRLVQSWLQDPVTVEVDEQNKVAELIEQLFFSVAESQKLHVLFWHLMNDNVERMLIFANRKDHTCILYKALVQRGVSCGLLSGDITQPKRIRVLEDFRQGKIQVIVATDVAARGIHVDNVSHVVNYDLPFEVEDYIHRVGRTGRAGTKGKSISMADEYGAYVIPDLEKFLDVEILCTQPPQEMSECPLPEEDHSIRVDLPGRGDRRGGGGRGGHGGGRGGRGGGGRGRSGGGRGRSQHRR
jgi:ATP-dependent RNA helicase RhlB